MFYDGQKKNNNNPIPKPSLNTNHNPHQVSAVSIPHITFCISAYY